MPPAAPRLLRRDLTIFDGRHDLPAPMAVPLDHGRIARLCPTDSLIAPDLEGATDMGHGSVITPGLVDCHIHLVFGGTRADEFARRLGEPLPARVVTTLLGAHALPPECQGDKDGHIRPAALGEPTTTNEGAQ